MHAHKYRNTHMFLYCTLQIKRSRGKHIRAMFHITNFQSPETDRQYMFSLGLFNLCTKTVALKRPSNFQQILLGLLSRFPPQLCTRKITCLMHFKSYLNFSLFFFLILSEENISSSIYSPFGGVLTPECQYCHPRCWKAEGCTHPCVDIDRHTPPKSCHARCARDTWWFVLV